MLFVEESKHNIFYLIWDITDYVVLYVIWIYETNIKGPFWWFMISIMHIVQNNIVSIIIDNWQEMLTIERNQLETTSDKRFVKSIHVV